MPSSCGLGLKLVPSSTVPNLLPNVVLNRVLSIEKIGVSSAPDISPTTGDLIFKLNLLCKSTCPVK